MLHIVGYLLLSYIAIWIAGCSNAPVANQPVPTVPNIEHKDTTAYNVKSQQATLPPDTLAKQPPPTTPPKPVPTATAQPAQTDQTGAATKTTNQRQAQPEPAAEAASGSSTGTQYSFPWLTAYQSANALVNRISPPNGFERITAAEGSFANWLRQLPLKEGKPQVLLYNGSPKGNQTAHFAVLNVDVGKEDLQQCADAVMRLRAEYLYHQQNYADIHFNYTSGHKAAYSQWRQGFRPVVSGNKVSWVQRELAANSTSYASFKQYLKQVFTYAGSLSLSKEMAAVGNVQNIEPGQVFIQGGSPGHAVIVLDVAQNNQGEKVFLLAQSYMPAQEIHVLINPNDANLSPWYSANIGAQLQTPEWTFSPHDLKKFK